MKKENEYFTVCERSYRTNRRLIGRLYIRKIQQKHLMQLFQRQHFSLRSNSMCRQHPETYQHNRIDIVVL